MSLLAGRTRLFQFNPAYAFLPELLGLLERAFQYYPHRRDRKVENEPAADQGALVSHYETDNEMTQIEMTAYVQTLVEVKGIKVILSGGAATAYRCANKYVSHDIDLVNVYSVPPGTRSNLTLVSLGFIEEARYFRHPDSKFFTEFPPVADCWTGTCKSRGRN